MNHNITDLGIPAETELRGIGISSDLMNIFHSEVSRLLKFLTALKSADYQEGADWAYPHQNQNPFFPKTLAEQNCIRKDTIWLQLFAKVRRG